MLEGRAAIQRDLIGQAKLNRLKLKKKKKTKTETSPCVTESLAVMQDWTEEEREHLYRDHELPCASKVGGPWLQLHTHTATLVFPLFNRMGEK